jgi:hypothetical protein
VDLDVHHHHLRIERKTMRTNREYQIGDRIDYEDMDDMDDMERDDLLSDLRQRSLTLYDDGSSRVVVWMYTRSGSLIEDLVVGAEQPEGETK